MPLQTTHNLHGLLQLFHIQTKEKLVKLNTHYGFKCVYISTGTWHTMILFTHYMVWAAFMWLQVTGTQENKLLYEKSKVNKKLNKHRFY